MDPAYISPFDDADLATYLSPSIANDTPLSLLCMMFLALGRLLPIISFAPFFGSRVMPHPVKVVFAITLYICFLPMLLRMTTTMLDFNLNLLFLLMKEILIGSVIGFLVSTPFTIVQNVGMLIDHQRGGASLMVNDPTIQNQSSPLGILFNMVLIYLFFQINGPFHLIDAIARSYEIIPPDRFLHPDFFMADTPFWKLQERLVNEVMVISVQLAGPSLVIILMTDLFLGIANRLAPQVQVTFLGMPLKSLLALMIICLGWKLFNKEVIRVTWHWLDVVDQAIGWLGYGADVVTVTKP